MQLQLSKRRASDHAHPDEVLLSREAACSADWRAIFGNENPIHVEVGFKHGEHLLHLAGSNPACNYVGIEHSRTSRLIYAEEAASAITGRKLSNVRLFLGDAVIDLEKAFAGDSVSAVYFKFPNTNSTDRLFTDGFLRSVHSVLSPEGTVYLDTESPGCAARWKASFERTGLPCSRICTFDIMSLPDGYFLTHDGGELCADGGPILSLEFRKPQVGLQDLAFPRAPGI